MAISIALVRTLRDTATPADPLTSVPSRTRTRFSKIPTLVFVFFLWARETWGRISFHPVGSKTVKLYFRVG